MSSKCWMDVLDFRYGEMEDVLTRVHWRTFLIRGKSRTPESRIEIDESRSRWEFWREATQPLREAIVPFGGGFDIVGLFSGMSNGLGGVEVFLRGLDEMFLSLFIP